MLFNDSKGLYNYCPSIYQDGDTRYIYYCVNLNPYKIVDYIGFRVGKFICNKWVYNEKTYVLGPNLIDINAWDHIHACDPSVIYGEFNYDNEIYSYCMAYLGCNTLNCTKNEIGLAFSKTPYGSWVKYNLNPIVSFDIENLYWGVGQPSIISIDKKGMFRIFYSRNDKNGSYTCFFDCDFNTECIKKTQPRRIKELGMTNKKGETDLFTNGDFVYDYKKNGYYVIRDRWVRDETYPSIITSELQLNYTHINILEDNSDEKWKVITNITINETNFKRNHNAGILRDKYGWLLKDNEIEIIYTSSIESKSNEDLIYLWNYRLNSYIVKI